MQPEIFFSVHLKKVSEADRKKAVAVVVGHALKVAVAVVAHRSMTAAALSVTQFFFSAVVLLSSLYPLSGLFDAFSTEKGVGRQGVNFCASSAIYFHRLSPITLLGAALVLKCAPRALGERFVCTATSAKKIFPCTVTTAAAIFVCASTAITKNFSRDMTIGRPDLK